MTSKNLFKQSVAVAAFAAATAVSVPASAYPVFQVQESAVPGALPNLVTADNINGRYVERIVFGGSGSFTSDGIVSIGSFNFGNAPQFSQLNTIPPIGYQLYALVTTSGTQSTAPSGLNTATFTGGNIQLFADPNQNTNTGNTACTVASCAPGGITADDILLATAPLASGAANFFPGAPGNPNGDYELIFNPFKLTDTLGGNDGNAYFVSPRPFYLTLDVNGNFTNFNPTGTQLVEGTANAFFAQVPEPGMLALLSLGLLGLGFSTRQRKDA